MLVDDDENSELDDLTASLDIDSMEEWFLFDHNAFEDDVDLLKMRTGETCPDKREWLVQDPSSTRKRSPRLYEFLILLLQKPGYQSCASFSNKSKGTFQIHQPERVAELWQAVKNRQSNQKMTYDKLARAVRWYYKLNIMQKTNTRFTFQFTPRILDLHFRDENNNSVIACSQK